MAIFLTNPFRLNNIRRRLTKVLPKQVCSLYKNEKQHVRNLSLIVEFFRIALNFQLANISVETPINRVVNIIFILQFIVHVHQTLMDP